MDDKELSKLEQLKQAMDIEREILGMVENFDCHSISCRECPLSAYKLCKGVSNG